MHTSTINYTDGQGAQLTGYFAYDDAVSGPRPGVLVVHQWRGVTDYERKRWPIEPPDTIDAIRYRMETGGYTQADLGRLLGSRQRASDILTRKRSLTMRMAWRLHREWGIPAEALIAPPRSRGRRSAA